MEELYTKIEGFDFVEINGVDIIANRCDIYTDCMILIYNNDTLVTKIKLEKLIDVKKINFHEFCNHYYIKYKTSKGFSDSVMYLKFKSEDKEGIKKEPLKLGDKVIPLDSYCLSKDKTNSDVTILGFALSNNKINVKQIEEIYEEIGWEVAAIIDDANYTIFYIKLNGEGRYITRDKIDTINDVKALANVLKELEEGE